MENSVENWYFNLGSERVQDILVIEELLWYETCKTVSHQGSEGNWKGGGKGGKGGKVGHLPHYYVFEPLI